MGIKQAKQSKQVSNQVSKQAGSLTAALQQLRPPRPRPSLSRRKEGMKGSLLGALNSLKIAYVQVETPKYLRPCSLACNCKIIWASDSGQVGGLPRKYQSYPLGEASRKIMFNFNLNEESPVNKNTL